MNVSRWISVGLLFVVGTVFPLTASAKPKHDSVPPQCRTGNGSIKCSKQGCERFCPRDARPTPPPPVAPKPPVAPPPPVAPKPPVAPPPPQHHHVQPVPPPVAPPPGVIVVKQRSLYEIDQDIALVNRDIQILNDQKRDAERRANDDYNMCRRSLPPYVANRCYYDDRVVKDLSLQINTKQHILNDLYAERKTHR